MPQIRVCPMCSKVLQPNEMHSCSTSEYTICKECGEKYLKTKPHICTTKI